jgi:hypothetical protein
VWLLEVFLDTRAVDPQRPYDMIGLILKSNKDKDEFRSIGRFQFNFWWLNTETNLGETAGFLLNVLWLIEK